jgi:integral membrane sensor domain MASE1
MVRRLLDNISDRLQDRRYLLTAGVIVIGYVLAERLGLSLSYTAQQVSTVWPPSGIALVVLLVLGRRYWPAIFLGALIANSLAHETLWVAAGIAVGDTLEAVAGAWLLRLLRFRGTFRRSRDVGLFALVAAVSTWIAALMGPAWLALGGNIEWSEYWRVAMLWWQGDFLGDLVFGPFLLAYLNPRSFDILRGRQIEAGLLLAATFAAASLIFTMPSNGPLAYPYLLFPFVMWAAVRFTQVGAVSTALLVTITAIWATTGGLGPFGHTSDVEAALVELQMYLAVLSATALFMAMAITERMAAEKALRRQAAKLELLDAELKEANRRVTKILAGVLDGSGARRGNDER